MAEDFTDILIGKLRGETQFRPELIQLLGADISSPTTPVSLKLATLKSLQYICDEIEDLKQMEVDSILGAVTLGIASDQSSICIAAMKALTSVIRFAKANMECETDLNYILSIANAAVTSQLDEMKQAGYEYLTALLRYESKLQPLIGGIAALALMEDREAVKISSIQFWCSVCQRAPNLIEDALPTLVPMLLQSLVGNQNICMAGRTCLGLVARSVGDSVVPLVENDVRNFISSEDWRNREAATFAIGLILEGPKVETLLPLVCSHLEILLEATKDQNDQVRDATAWTLSRIFELVHFRASEVSAVTPANIERVLSVLRESLEDAPNVVLKICDAIYYLAQGFEFVETSSFGLTPFTRDIRDSLMAKGTAATDTKLRSAAYKALNETVRCAKMPESAEFVEETLLAMLSLESSQPGDLQALMFGLLKVIIHKLNTDAVIIIIKYVDNIMDLSLDTFMAILLKNREGHHAVIPPILSCFGGIALAIGPKFEKYMVFVIPFLQSASKLCAHPDDTEIKVEKNILIYSILECYSGLFEGYPAILEGCKGNLIISSLIEFINLTLSDSKRDQSVTKAAISLLTRLSCLESAKKVVKTNCTVFVKVLVEVMEGDDDYLKTIGLGARSVISGELTITQDLFDALSDSSATLRNNSKDRLVEFWKKESSFFFMCLAVELGSNERPIQTRQLAGIMLKNSLNSSESESDESESDGLRWLTTERGLKSEIKLVLLRTLKSKERLARLTAALVIARVAAIEFPYRSWPDLVSRLVENLTEGSPTIVKEATMLTFTYLFEDCEILEADVTLMLRVIATHVMSSNSVDVRLAATKALCSLLHLANLDDGADLILTLDSIWAAISYDNLNIMRAGFDCLFQILHHHFDKVDPHINTLLKLICSKVEGCVTDNVWKLRTFLSTQPPNFFDPEFRDQPQQFLSAMDKHNERRKLLGLIDVVANTGGVRRLPYPWKSC